MRTINFRAWDNETKKIYSVHSFSAHDDGTVELWSFDIDGEHKLTDYVLEQYTGVDDVSGKPIYEGDIVRDEDGICEQVVFSDGGFFAGDMSVWDASLGYVIGNIHENPDLLEIGYIQEEE